MKKTSLYIVLMLMLASCGAPRQVSTPTAYDQPKPQIRPGSMVPEKSVPDRKKKSNIADDIEKEARRWIGTPYKFGGKDRNGTDCSGMVMSVYEIATGIKLPRDSRAQQEWCYRIDRSRLRKGDLVFFSSKTAGSNVSHVGIYIEDGNFIHASSSRGVIVSNLSEKYYDQHFHSAGRVSNVSFEEAAPKPAMAPTKIEKTIKKESPTDTVKRSADEADSIRATVRRAMKF